MEPFIRDPGIFSEEEMLSYKGIEFLRKWISGEIPYPPFMTNLHMKLTHVENKLAIVTLNPVVDYYNHIGAIHGGIVATLLDTAMICSIISVLSRGQTCITLELKINYIRSVYEKTGPIHAEAHLIHFAANTASAEGKITDDRGRLYAFGSTTGFISHPLRGKNQ